MAHYAFLNGDGIVTQVIVGRNENDLPDGITSWEAYYGNRHNQTCRRTSYNTRANQHLLGGIPFRGNYAGIGYRYDDNLDAFIPPQPYPSWVLNETTCLWDAPVARPDDGLLYNWDEASQSWQEVTDGL
jgi:hypothetical protein